MVGNKRMIPRYERETVILRSDDEEKWTVYSCSPPMMRRLSKLIGRDGVEVLRNELDTIELLIPKAWVSIRAVRAHRHLTPEQRKAMGKRLQAGRIRSKSI